MKMINTYGVILASKKELFGKIVFIPTEIIMFYNLKTARENFNRILKQKSQKIILNQSKGRFMGHLF